MARKLRIERAGALYHVLNRGNFQFDVFESTGAKQAFLRCLDEACARTGWLVHAWAIMRNHFHAALETPEPNLISGMQWLQTTFCARFNRFRKIHGHVFQGRYKAFPVAAGEPLGALCQYIHLNPVEADLLAVDQLSEWPWTSYRWLQNPELRTSWYRSRTALESPCAFLDTEAGRANYCEYLAWLSQNEDEKKRLRFDEMTTQWAFGPPEFKRELLDHTRKNGVALPYGSAELREAHELTSSLALATVVAKLSPGCRQSALKSADWKVAVAAVMKAQTTASNPWLATQLRMGAPSMVSRLAAECRQGLRATELYAELTSKR
jgi:putative transposase